MTYDEPAASAGSGGDGPLLSPEEFRSGNTSPLAWGFAALVCNPCLITSFVAFMRGFAQLRAIERMGASRTPSFAGLRAEAYATIALACAWPLLILSVVVLNAVMPGGLRRTPPARATYDFWEARREHPTHLVRRGAAPQEFEDATPDGVEVVHYRSDVGELLGWVLQPRHTAPGTRLPTMVYAHGGFALGEGDLHTAELFADAGMLVFLPAVRGENGNPGHYEMFFAEVDDLLAATRYVATRPDVDPERIFVFGHSAGGGLSSLLALHADAPVAATGSAGGMYLPIALLDFGPELLPFDMDDAWETQLRSMLPHAGRLQIPHTAYVGEDDEFIMQDIEEIRELGARGGSLFALEIVEGDHHTSLDRAAIDFMTRVVPELAIDPAEVRRVMLGSDEAALARMRGTLLENPIPLRPEARRALLALAVEVTNPSDPSLLLRSALQGAPDATLRELPALAPRLNDQGRRTLISVLSRSPSREATEVLTSIAASAGTESDIQMPALYALVEHCASGRASRSLATLAPAVDTRLTRLWPAVERADRERTWDVPDYQSTRADAGVLLDLVGCLPDAAPSPWIARGAALRDLRLRLYATMAGLRVGVRPTDESVREMAAFDQTRAMLLEALETAHAEALFPEEFWTREALARSHATVWLEYPTELGEPPRTLEVVAEVPEGVGHYVVMRFLGPEGEPDADAWLVMIAGPYPEGRPPAASPIHTFSDFERMDAATPRQHVQRIVARFPTD